MPRILLLIPTTSYRATDFLAAAEDENVDLIIGSNEQQALHAVVPDRSLELDFFNPQEAVKKAVGFAQRYPLDAVVATDEEAVLSAALIAEALGLPHNPMDALRATQDKYRLRTILTQAAVLTPQATCFSITERPEEIAAKRIYPVVLKPLHLSASRGVIRADDPASFVEGFHRIIAILKAPEVIRRNPEAAQKILVESFIPGMEVAVEGMLHQGSFSILALFDKPDPLDGPFFEETIYVTPSRLPDATCKEIEATTEQACRAIGLKTGPVHAELRIHADRVYVIEVAARSIGGLCSRTLQWGLGLSLETLILRQALSKPIAGLTREETASGVMMIPIPQKGTLAAVGGMDDARRVEGICGVEITTRLNQEVLPLPEGNRYLGFIFARAKTPDGVERALRQAHSRLSFDITP